MATTPLKDPSAANLLLLLDPVHEAQRATRSATPPEPEAARGEPTPRAAGNEKRRQPAETQPRPPQHPNPRRERAPVASAKTRPNVSAEHCSGCAAALGPFEMAFVWESGVVCGKCYQRRQAAHILAAVVAPQMPAPAFISSEAGHAGRAWFPVLRRFLRRPVKKALRFISQ